MKRNNKIKFILYIIYFLTIISFLYASFYIKIKFANETVEEFYFYLTNGLTHSDYHVYHHAIKWCAPYIFITFIFIYSLFYNILGNRKVGITKKKIKLLKTEDECDKTIYPFNFIHNHRLSFTIIISIICIFIMMSNLKIFSFIKNSISTSSFIEDNYVVVNKDDIILDKKRNLVMIYVESLETTLFTNEQGGDWDYEVIPELYKLLLDKDAQTFSSGNKYEGMLNVVNSSWTTASIISNTTGLPFNIPIDGNKYNSTNFMNGSYALGDYLYEEGYNNEVISGADTYFGGINAYFTKHGNYNVIDSTNALANGLNYNDNARGAWGINDKYVFEFARERIELLANSDKPFNETIITIDTHPIDGNKLSYTYDKYDTQYENVYRTTSLIIYDFINWLKSQPFYKDTAIIIIGDHPSMQTDYFIKYDQNKRNRYFVIINSVVKATNNKNRVFTSLDTYPTILAAMGAKIKNDKIALGVNLFSDKETLGEIYGLSFINEELNKKSIFYNNKILGLDYYNMLLTD